jgi:hypothetical protein
MLLFAPRFGAALPGAFSELAFEDAAVFPFLFLASTSGFFFTASASLFTSYIQNINFTPLIPSPQPQTIFGLISST